LQDNLKNQYLNKILKLLEPGDALIYASSDTNSGSIPTFKSAPSPASAPKEKVKWLRPNHAVPGAPAPQPCWLQLIFIIVNS